MKLWSERHQRWVFVASLLALLTGFGPCQKKEEPQVHPFDVVEIVRQPDDVPLPDSLWEKLRDLGAPPAEATESSKGNPTEAKKANVPTEFSPIIMYMVEKNEGILGGRDFELRFPPGGGEIDLADFVQSLKGSFRVSFKFMPDLEGAVRAVFFLGATQPRQIGSERIGADCDKYFDITSAASVNDPQTGILVNTTDRRHVSALVGTYYFAAVGLDKKVRLASIIVRDRNSRDLACRR